MKVDHRSYRLTQLLQLGKESLKKNSGMYEIRTLDLCDNIFSTVILASHSFLQFVAFWCRSAFIVASDWFVLPI